MFILKLFKGHSIKLVCANEVDIGPAGRPEGTTDQAANNEVREIFVRNLDGANQEAYYVADPKKPRPNGWADATIFYDIAYIENAYGATTETVRPY